MGKGNRSRTDRAADVLTAPAGSKNQTADKTKSTTIIACVCVALLLVFFIGIYVYQNFAMRMTVAVKSENYSVSGTMMSYFYRTQYNQFMTQFGSYASYLGLETGVSLKEQTEPSSGNTWFNYFMDSAKTGVAQMLELCEGARAEGIKLDDKDQKSIDDTIDTIASYALQYNYSTSGYIAAMYGQGVNESDVRKCLELSALASKYFTVLSDRFSGEVTGDEAAKYCEENPTEFLSADTMQYDFTATLTMEGAEATANEQSAFDADKAEAKKKAEALKAAATSADAFKAFMIDYLCDNEADGYFRTSYEIAKGSAMVAGDEPDEATLSKDIAEITEYVRKTLKGQTPTEFDTTANSYRLALKTICADVQKAIERDLEALNANDIAYADPTAEGATELQKWLFADGRKAGDVEIIETTSDSENSSAATYSVVLVTSPKAKDTSISRSVAHILLTPETYGSDADTSAKANDILKEYAGTAGGLDAFKTLGEKYTEDSSVVYENVCRGDMVTEFEDWLFDDARKDGDVGIVQSTYGYHVMYYIGEGEEAWLARAKSALAGVKMEDWYKETEAKYGVSFNERAINSIPD